MTVSFEDHAFQHYVPLLGLTNFDTVPASAVSLQCSEQTLASLEHSSEFVLVFTFPYFLMIQDVLRDVAEICLHSVPLCCYFWLAFLRKVVASLWYDRHS